MQGFACGLEFALQECAPPFGFGAVFYNSKDCRILFVGANSWTDSTTVEGCQAVMHGLTAIGPIALILSREQFF